MNKKLIALAVSSAIAAPLAMAEDSGPNLYGRINLALEVDDSGDDTVTDLRDVVSRFGIKGEEDLGNGLAALYQYEFRVNADRGNLGSTGGGGATQRLSWVGLKGGFGTFKAGSIWGTHFNFTGTHLDPSYSLGYFGYSSYGGGDYRIESVVNYTGNFGPVSVGIDFQVDDANAADDNLDRFVVGVKYNGPITAAVTYDERSTASSTPTVSGVVLPDGTLDITEVGSVAGEGDNDIEILTGILAYSGDGFNVNVGIQQAEDDSGALDRSTYHINGGFNVGDSNRILLGYWTGEGDGADTSEGDGVLLGFYHSLSSRTRLYFEGHSGEINDGDRDVYLFGVRHDF